VLRRLRRPAAALGAVLLIPAIAACGGGGSSTKDAGATAKPGQSADATATPGLSAVTFSGEVGKSLTATWHTTLASPKSTTVTTLVKGTGSAIADGDTVSTYLYVGDGTTKKDAYSDYTNGTPESIPNNAQLSDLFSKLLTGSTYGSRVVAVTTARDLLGSSSGDAQLGIGANDSLVIVADLVKKAAVSPTPADDSAHDVSPSKLPKVVLQKDIPVGLDWTGIARPSLTTPVQRVILKKGTGPAVTASDTVTVNYLGETYQAKSPFDESYTKKAFTQALSGLIPGWSIGLTGVNVGSRVLLEIPPADGYGAQGSGTTIPGNATLWFVIDVLQAQ
jgi:peptidylprolyl isomerase